MSQLDGKLFLKQKKRKIKTRTLKEKSFIIVRLLVDT